MGLIQGKKKIDEVSLKETYKLVQTRSQKSRVLVIILT